MSENSKLEQQQLDDLGEHIIKEFEKDFDCLVDKENGKVSTVFVDIGTRCMVDVSDLDIGIDNKERRCTENYTMKLQTMRHRVASVSNGDISTYGMKRIEYYNNGVEHWLENYCTDSEKVCGDCKDDMKEEKKDYFTKLAEKNVDKMEDE